MRKDQIPKINSAIKRTRRAVVALGCSFVQGHGALNQKIYQNYPWEGTALGHPNVKWNLSQFEMSKLIDEFPDITISVLNDIDFSYHETNNSFVNVLANKYFEESYAAINLGRSGCGNRATIKELYFYPELMWDHLDEIIVIYCPSGMERFDFIDDRFHSLNEHGRWICAWPNDCHPQGPTETLWKGYSKALYSDKFETLEQIAHVQELMMWCRYKNAKLIIVPAFQDRYTESTFQDSLSLHVDRDYRTGAINSAVYMNTVDESVKNMANMWPWDKMFKPNGYNTFVDLAMSQELSTYKNTILPYFYTLVGTGSPDCWITPCAHPSAKAHDLFAQVLHNEITKNLNSYEFR